MYEFFHSEMKGQHFTWYNCKAKKRPLGYIVKIFQNFEKQTAKVLL